MPKHHRKHPDTPTTLEHCESNAEKATKADQGYLKKYTSAPIISKQEDPLISTRSRDIHKQKDSKQKLLEGVGSSNQNSYEKAPLRQAHTQISKHHRRNLDNPHAPVILEHCDSAAAVSRGEALQQNEGDLRKHTSTPALFKQAHSLDNNKTPETQVQKHPKYKLHQGAGSGSPNKKVHSENPLRGQTAKQHEDQNRSKNVTHESRYFSQVPSKHAVGKRDRIEKYYPDHKYWSEKSHFPIHSLVKPEEVPYIGSASEKNQVWNEITAGDSKFKSYNLPFTTSEDVGYALWEGNNVIINTKDRCDLILGWHRSEKIFLVIKLFTKKNRPHLEELMYRGTTSLFLSGTRSIPCFYGLIYVGRSPKYVSFGLVNRFIGIDLKPTTLRSFIDELQKARITQLPDKYQFPMLRRAVFMCINLIDQLQKIHDYGAVLNTFPPETIVFEYHNKNIPYFTHLTDITYQMDTLGGRASDFVLAKLKNSSQCLRQLSSMTADPNKNTDLSIEAGRSDDMLEIGKIIYAIGRVTDLPAVTWLGERLLCTRPSKRPGIQLVRIQLSQTLMNLKQQTDLRSYQMKSSKMLSVDSRNDHDHVDYFHLAEQHANAFKDSHSVSTCSSNYMGNNPVNLKQCVIDKENYSNGRRKEEKSTHHVEKTYSHEAYPNEESGIDHNEVISDEGDNAHHNEAYPNEESGIHHNEAYHNEEDNAHHNEDEDEDEDEDGSYCEEKIDSDFNEESGNSTREESSDDSSDDSSFEEDMAKALVASVQQT